MYHGVRLSSVTLAACAWVLFVAGCGAVAGGMDRGGSSANSGCNPLVLKRVAPAINEAKGQLTRNECRTRFGWYYEQVLDVAADNSDVGKENLELIRQFIDWGFQENLLSRNEGKTLYSEYFSVKFRAFPDDMNICSTSRDMSGLKRALNAELEKKRKGLWNILDDREQYQTAVRVKDEMLIILETVGDTCSR